MAFAMIMLPTGTSVAKSEVRVPMALIPAMTTPDPAAME